MTWGTALTCRDGSMTRTRRPLSGPGQFTLSNRIRKSQAVEEALQASTSTGVGTKAGGHSSNTKLQSGGSGDIVVVLFAVPWSPTSLYVAESLDEARACGELAKVAMFIVNSDSCADKAWELGVESPLPTLIVYSGGAPLRWRRPTRETSIRLDHGITRRNVTSVLRCAFDATRAGKTVASLGF